MSSVGRIQFTGPIGYTRKKRFLWFIAVPTDRGVYELRHLEASRVEGWEVSKSRRYGEGVFEVDPGALLVHIVVGREREVSIYYAREDGLVELDYDVRTEKISQQVTAEVADAILPDESKARIVLSYRVRDPETGQYMYYNSLEEALEAERRLRIPPPVLVYTTRSSDVDNVYALKFTYTGRGDNLYMEARSTPQLAVLRYDRSILLPATALGNPIVRSFTEHIVKEGMADKPEVLEELLEESRKYEELYRRLAEYTELDPEDIVVLQAKPESGYARFKVARRLDTTAFKKLVSKEGVKYERYIGVFEVKHPSLSYQA